MKQILAVLLVVASTSAAFAYTGATVGVFDVQAGDVPGPQPIHVFPIPAAAGMSGAQLIYDNYANLAFSAGYQTAAERNWVTMPLTAPGITINSVDYNGEAYGPFAITGVNNAFAPQAGLYTNIEDTPADNRFPTHIPRPGRYAGYDYTAVQFALDAPVHELGVYVAMNSNCWMFPWTDATADAASKPIPDDNNRRTPPLNPNLTGGRKYWVAVLGETDTFATAQLVHVSAANMYAPFIKVTWNGNQPIKSVCVVEDSSIEAGAPFGFFDVYVLGAPVRCWGDIDGSGMVNGDDLAILAYAWLATPADANWYAPADLTGDNVVNGDDLAVVAYGWLQCIPM